MPLVVDTHSLVWHMAKNPKLSSKAKRGVQKGISTILLNAPEEDEIGQ